ncbi:DUF899 domain-containing protein [Sphingopyxis sp. YF1]|jgi:predicted dithiol-disulfide oxidoreductase (DUF899 family)|uniref:DUF899 family protein n=1 Tax=Sphingopyxis sp. YF1 TaxID=2482763 RepID=UPI001F618BBD|nr:DUF899 family protein [Sphingopyxis sp. YF1]UNU42029.1 DUF899 domain-containing protein [Sphingopyxis sp. YF1]
MALRQPLLAAPALASRRRAFPGEDDAYARARKSLLAEEIDLRRKIARVAAQRRALPPGPLVKDYRFRDAEGTEGGLADLFGAHDTLVAYFWMYGPERERPCPMCTNWLGAVNGNAADIAQRVALRVVGRSPVDRQQAFARERGWHALDFVQTVGDDYARDFHLLNPDGSENPALAVFQKGAGGVRLFWKSDMTRDMADPGQDPRDAPDVASLWTILDLTPGGRGTGWYPSLDYGVRTG